MKKLFSGFIVTLLVLSSFAVAAQPATVEVEKATEGAYEIPFENTGDLLSVTDGFLYTNDSVKFSGSTAIYGPQFSSMNTTGNAHIASETVNGEENYFFRVSPPAGATSASFPALVYPINQGNNKALSGTEVYVKYKARIAPVATGLTESLIGSTNFQLRTVFNGTQTINHGNPSYDWNEVATSYTLTADGSNVQLYFRITPSAGLNYSVDMDDIKIIFNPVTVTYAGEGASVPSSYKAYTGEQIKLGAAEKMGFAFDCWTDTDGNKYREGDFYTVNSNTVLTASFKALKNKGEPGINLLTGTADPMTFDGYEDGTDASSMFLFAGTFNSKIIKNGCLNLTSSAGQWPAFGIGQLVNEGGTPGASALCNKYPTMTDNRPVQVTYMFAKNYKGTETVKHQLFIMKNNFSWVHSKPNGFGDGMGTWYSNSVKFEPNVLDTGNDAGKKAPLTAIMFEMAAQTDTTEFLFDKLSFIPYYKVTYMNPKGEAVKTEYVLLDESGNLLSEYVIDSTFVYSNAGGKSTGWTTTPGSSEAVTSVALNNEDIELYPVWESNAPDIMDVASIRTETHDAYGQGIRFAAFVDEARRESALEYGFIVTRKVLLGSYGTDELRFEDNDTANVTGKTENGVAYVSGASYNVKENIDKVYSIDGNVFGESSLGEGYYFTSVLHNIPKNQSAYNDVLVARPYLKTAEGIVYGETVARSICEVAKSVKNAGYPGLLDFEIELIDEIIGIAEGTVIPE